MTNINDEIRLQLEQDKIERKKQRELDRIEFEKEMVKLDESHKYINEVLDRLLKLEN